jgi:spermidine/putrescine transport system permease protein
MMPGQDIEEAALGELTRRYGASLTWGMIGLTAFWLVILVALPYMLMFEFSLRPYLTVEKVGGPEDVYTLKNYVTLFSNTIHFGVFLRTILASAFVTALCLVLCYPMAFFLAKIVQPKNAATLFLLLLIPFWVNEILRSFAWFIILSYQGPLNAALQGIGLIERPIRWLTGGNGVIVGLVYTYLLFMLLPIYNAIQSLDSNQIEAAEDLGSPFWRTHWRVVIPHAKPGIASGCVMVFMLSAGSIIVPSLLGSPGTRWFTEIIQQWFFEGQDWNQGSAYAFLLLILCTGFVMIMMRLLNVRLTDIAK